MATTSIIGTEEKFSVYIAPIGDLHIIDCDFSVKAYSNSKTSVIIPKDNAIFVSDDNFIICVDTNALGLGQITIEITAFIPDLDFPDGLRTEIARYKTDTTIIS